MKKIFIFCLLLFSFLSIAGEMTGAGLVRNIMAKQNLSLDQFLNTGHTLLMGEVTGAGREIQLGNIKVVIASGMAFKMKNVNNIQFLGKGGLGFNNIKTLEINQKVIYKNEIQAILIKQKL